MGVSEGSAAVSLLRVILAYYVVVIVIDIDLFVVVDIFVVVWRRGVDGAGRHVPFVAPVGQAREFIEGAERTDALDILNVEALRCVRLGGQFHQSAQTAACLVDRRCAVEQRCLVYEIGGYGREVGHAKHRIVDAHTVPCHLCMAR